MENFTEDHDRQCQNHQFVIYVADDQQVQIDVQLRHETIWLSLAQMAILFEKDSDTIGLHLKNIYYSGELVEQATTDKSSVVRQEGKRQVKRNMVFYNLDAVISVGYRVNSKKGTQFRIWASNVLKQYLLQGYALNQQRLQAQQEKLADLKRVLTLTSRLFQIKSLSVSQSQGILSILERYRHALAVLDDCLKQA